MKQIIGCIVICLLSFNAIGQGVASSSDYLDNVKVELNKKWPKNRTVNVVFHGHSVPSGYYNTPNVHTLQAYPHLVLKGIKEQYPHAVVNVITTSIGGENSTQGVKRFKAEVLPHNADVLFIDYALNDRNVTLEEARKAWSKMIVMAKKKNVKVILCTPSPDKRVDLKVDTTILDQHSDQIRALAAEYEVGLVDSYRGFKDAIAAGAKVEDFMATVNHPNDAGHILIAKKIMSYFNK
ncbi:SGNH/GDSL hydrolase family protein [Saccharicrinis aurantiacus]|uniref:SGNH/GDSL hydrolase family protein n=1 Tax=Saccharicrinis aurantiacus TaxID=1849719 RepID=UPI002492F81F|nr:GDSL-type esterase/lipase family protein [Saccharicrinis aurantiacus]